MCGVRLRLDDARYNRQMPNIILNGESRQFETLETVEQLLAAAGFSSRNVAVEINREIVPKSQHAARAINEGDRIEIVHALGGG